jgi:hypothetical protein
MADEQNTTVRVIVKLRDLDTDARTVFEHHVVPPRSTAEERSRLIDLVAEHKPEATIRSFANHAASFVDGEHLVVAYFEDPGAIRKALNELARQDGQAELFPATTEDEAA